MATPRERLEELRTQQDESPRRKLDRLRQEQGEIQPAVQTEESGLSQEIDAALLKIPGAPTLAEFRT